MVARTGAASAERRGDRARRRGLRRPGLLRVRDRHPAHRRAGRRRAALHGVPHDDALLAVASVSDDGPQPPQRRHVDGRRVGHRLPELPQPHHPGGGDARRGALRPGHRHVRRRQVAPRTAAGDDAGRPVPQLAARQGLRPLLRVPVGLHRPVPPRAGPRQQRRRGAPPSRGRLPPERGPGRRGGVVPDRPPGARAGTPLLPAPRVRRLPLAAAGTDGVPREVPGALRRGVGRAARAALRAPARRGHRPCGHRAAPARRRRARLGRARRRRAALRGTPARGLRRVPRPHRRPDRTARRVPPRRRPARRHRSSCSCPTTAPARRADRRAT